MSKVTASAVNKIRKRATAIFIEDGKVLLFKRVRPGLTYYIFPGGGVEDGETLEQGLEREVHEELSVDALTYTFLFSADNIRMPEYSGHPNQDAIFYYYLIQSYKGTFALGGPEKASMNENNQYHFVWKPIDELPKVEGLFPSAGLTKLVEYLHTYEKTIKK